MVKQFSLTPSKSHVWRSRDVNGGVGVTQGDIISPVFFIIVINQLIQMHDVDGSGIKVGHINEIRV